MHDVKISEHLTFDERQRITQLFEEFKDVFSDIPIRSNAIENKIVLTTDTSIRAKPYPIPLHFRNQVNEEIQGLLRLEIIEE